MQTILVTGTSGYLGSQIATYLESQGKYAVIRLAHRKNFIPEAESIFRSHIISVVIHAGFHVDFSLSNDLGDKHQNIAHTQALLQLSEKFAVSQFIFLSAAAVLGVSESPFPIRTEENWAKTDAQYSNWLKTRYVREKIDCEKLLQGTQLSSLVLYLTTTYGKGMQKSVRDTLRRLEQPWHKCILYPPGGTSYLDLDDFLRALDIALTKKLTGKYIISSGNLNYKQLFTTVLKNSTKATWQFWLPLPKSLSSALKLLGNQEILYSTFGYKYYSATKFQRATGWQPQINIETSLRKAFTP